jgi:hypothetical protein
MEGRFFRSANNNQFVLDLIACGSFLFQITIQT